MSGGGIERAQRGVSRVLVKLDNSIEAGNFYEAHQMYRTLYFRYISQRKYDDCLELLYNGSVKLAEKKQEASAADLGLLLIETLSQRSNASNDEWQWEIWIKRLSTLIGQLSPTTVERDTLINRALKWSGEMCDDKHGHPALHKFIAQIYWVEGNYEMARSHYILCKDGKVCGRILIKLQCCKGYSNEIDLFIAQAVFQQLCLKDRKTAEETFTTYTTLHPHISQKDIPFTQPLLNFVYFVFRLIDSGNLNAFKILCKLYRPTLKRDPSFENDLSKIGVLYLGAMPPTTPNGGLMGGMFGDFFNRLFRDIDEDGEEQRHNQIRVGGGDGSDLD